MYRYTDFDRQLLRQRAAQFRDPLERWQRGQLTEERFRPLRLQSGWYVQRHAPMLGVAVPYGELCSRQLRMLARIAREFDRQDPGRPTERGGFGHFTTRQDLHIRILDVDKDGSECDRLKPGGADCGRRGGPAVAGKVVGPALAGERFIDTVRRLGTAAARAAAGAARHGTAAALPA